jgi:hypothetical protein
LFIVLWLSIVRWRLGEQNMKGAVRGHHARTVPAEGRNPFGDVLHPMGANRNYWFLMFWFDNRILLRKKHLRGPLALSKCVFALIYSTSASRMLQ